MHKLIRTTLICLAACVLSACGPFEVSDSLGTSPVNLNSSIPNSEPSPTPARGATPSPVSTPKPPTATATPRPSPSPPSTPAPTPVLTPTATPSPTSTPVTTNVAPIIFVTSTNEIIARPLGQTAPRNYVGSGTAFPLNVVAYDDGKIASTQWTQVSGPTSLKFGSKTTAGEYYHYTSVDNFTYGTYQLRFDATDDSGKTSSAVFKVTFPQYPELAAGTPSTYISIDRSETIYAPDYSRTIIETGGQLSANIRYQNGLNDFNWTQISGPNFVTITTKQQSPTGTMLGFKDATYGTYEFKIDITSTSGDKASERMKVTFLRPMNAPLPPPSSCAGGPARFMPALIFSPTHDDIYGPKYSSSIMIGSGNIPTILGRMYVDTAVRDFILTQVAGPNRVVILSKSYDLNAGSIRFGFKDATFGTYEFLTSVVDCRGNVASETYKFTLAPPLGAEDSGKAPVISFGSGTDVLVRPAALATPINYVTSGLNFQIRAVVYDDGSVTDHKWTQISGPTQLIPVSDRFSGENFWLDVKGFTYGTYEMRLDVTDNSGMKSSKAIRFTFPR